MADLNDIPLDQLDAMMRDPAKLQEFDAQNAEPEPLQKPPTQEPKEADLAPPESAQPAPAAETQPSEDKPAEPTVEERLAELRAARDQDAIDRERFIAQIELQRAHNARLAGELGHVKEQLKRPRPEVVTNGHDPDAETDGETPQYIRQVMDKLESLESRSRSQEVAAEVAQGVASARGDWDAAEYSKELEAVMPNYRDDWDLAISSTDPKTARILAAAVTRNIIADAKEAKFKAARANGADRSADQMRGVKEAKLKASISGTGASPAPAPKEKTLEDMDMKELEAIMLQDEKNRRALAAQRR